MTVISKLRTILVSLRGRGVGRDSLIDQADWARDRGAFADAAALYGQHLRDHPRDFGIQVQCAHMFKEAGELGRAEEHYLLAVKLQPDDADLNLQLGHFYKICGRLDEAAMAYKRAAKLVPGWAEPLAELAALANAVHLSQQNDHDPLVAGPTRGVSPAASVVTIVAPNDWARVDAQPVIEITSTGGGDLTVDFVKLQDFQSKADFAKPAASAPAQFDPSTGRFTAQCGAWLDDGPHVAVVRRAHGKPLATVGVIVDLFEGWSNAYENYLNTNKELLRANRKSIETHINNFIESPNFLIVIDTTAPGKLSETIASLENQIYQRWSLVLEDSALAPARPPQNDFIIFLDAGDRLDPETLYEFAAKYNGDPTIDLMYADEDIYLTDGSRVEPFFKPDWSPDYLEVFNYIGRPACIRTATAKKYLTESLGYYDFILRLTEVSGRIVHVRRVLCSRPIANTRTVGAALAAEKAALEARVRRTGRTGSVVPLHNNAVGWEVRAELTAKPLVSIVIPTAGKRMLIGSRRIDLVVNCVKSIVTKSTYSNFEVIIVDNGDLLPDQKFALSELNCQFITYAEPIFNISKKLELGVSVASGSFLILMNDDIELITPQWIELMLGQFEKPHVGVVGVKLLYPNRKLQHAGVVHNYGNPDHVRRNFDSDDRGYYLSNSGVKNYMAVTGACMMVRAKTFNARSVKGYTKDLAVSFNDIDFCLKVGRLGLATVYTPHVELIHFESQSRKPVMIQEEWEFYQKKWAVELTSDPYYNDQFLSIAPPTFDINVNPNLI